MHCIGLPVLDFAACDDALFLGFMYIKLFACVAVHPICRQEAHCLALFA